MRYARVQTDAGAAYARIQDDLLLLLDGAPFLGGQPTGQTLPLCGARLLAPCEPSKIVAVGINYRDHATEMGHDLPQDPIIFIKPATSVIGPEDAIIRPADAQRVDYEAELAFVVGARCKDVSAADAHRYIFGYTCLNDVTARDLQKRDGQWTRAKGFDTFCPLGPWIETQFDPTCAGVRSRLNGRVMQQSDIAYFINPVPALLAFVSRVMTLLPGDVVTTGTPSGIGPMQAGDVIEIEVDGIGTLRNTVR